MPDDPTPARSPTLLELLPIKHSFNQQVTYGHAGLNATEAERLLRGDDIDWAKNWREYDGHYVNTLGSVFARPPWALLSLLASVALVVVGGWARAVGGALFLYVMYQLCKEAGHRAGYYDGFTDGHISAMKTAFGITDADEEDISSRATEIEIDEGVLRRAAQRTEGNRTSK